MSYYCECWRDNSRSIISSCASDTELPKYHFDLIDHVTVADQGGRDLNDDAEAMDFAERLAGHLRVLKPELIGRKYAVLVTDENGAEIHRSPLDVERRIQ